MAGCGSSSSGSSGASGGKKSASAGPTTITYLSNAGSIDPMEVASYLGYLGNLKIKSVGTATGGPASFQAVATGDIDIAGGFNGSIIDAIRAGAKVKAVVGFTGVNKQTYQGLWVRSNSSIHSAKDLIGKTIGVNTLGADEEQWVDLWLAHEGLSTPQIKQVDMVVVPRTVAPEALRSGRLDAAVLTGAIQTTAVKEGGYRLLATDVGLLGPHTGDDYILRTSFMQQYPQTTRELVTGIAKAVHWLQVTPRAEVIKIGDKIALLHGRASDIPILKNWESNGVQEPYGVIRPIDYTVWIKAEEDEGKLKPGQVSLSELYTNAYNAYASH